MRSNPSRGELRRDPTNATAIRDYDFAIARVFQIIQEAKLDPWTQAADRARREGRVSFSPISQIRARSGIPPSTILRRRMSSTLAANMSRERTTRDGIGAADCRRRARAE